MMKIRKLMTWVLGPILLLIPMMCTHLGDDHHTGSHHSLSAQPAFKPLTLDQGTGDLLPYTFSPFQEDVVSGEDFIQQNCS